MGSPLTGETLAQLVATTPERVRKLADLGLIQETAGGFRAGDVHRVRLVEAFEAAGVPAEALARASRHGTISLDYYDQLHQDPGMPSPRTYGEFASSLGDQGPHLSRLFEGSGLAEPGLSDRLSADEESLLLELLDALDANRHPDLAERTLRVFGLAARRTSEAAMSVYSEAVERADREITGIPPMEVYERFLEPWARFARLVPRLTAWLHARHLSAAIDAWSVEETERLLADSGFVPPRVVEQPAVVFVDLTAFTSLAERRGDEAAAATAGAFFEMARGLAEPRTGRVVKQLGDGVLLRFPDALTGVETTLDLLEELQASTLPSGHAGIETGPLVVREGDVFGRTVNRASRIADVAEAGQLLASEDLAERLPRDRVRANPVGAIALHGIAEPVRLARLMRAGTAS